MTSHPFHLSPESSTEHIKTDASEIIVKCGCEGFLFLKFDIEISLKNSCNEKLLKIGGAEVGETKRQAGKEEAL